MAFAVHRKDESEYGEKSELICARPSHFRPEVSKANHYSSADMLFQDTQLFRSGHCLVLKMRLVDGLKGSSAIASRPHSPYPKACMGGRGANRAERGLQMIPQPQICVDD